MGGFSFLDQDNISHILTDLDFWRGFSIARTSHSLSCEAFDFRHGCISLRDCFEVPPLDIHRGYSILVSDHFWLATTPKEIILGEIESDRSISAWPFRLIAISYAMWFVFEYGARVHYGSPITELEFATLVLVIFHALIYMVWWHKPFGVHEETHLKPVSDVVENDTIVPPAVERCRWFPSFFPDSVPTLFSSVFKHFRTFITIVGSLTIPSVMAERPEVVRIYWREHHWHHSSLFFIAPILIFFEVILLTFRVGLSMCIIIFRVKPPTIRNPGFVARTVVAIQNTRRTISNFIQNILDLVVARTNYLFFILDACIVLPACLALIPISFFPIFIFNFLVIDLHEFPEEVTLAETSGYILKTSRRIILAISHFPEKGAVGLVNIPVLCIGFILLLSFSPFALAIIIFLRFTNTTELESTDSEDTNSRLTIPQARKMVISTTHSAQKCFKGILMAPDTSQFGVTHYILFLPLSLLAALLSLVSIFVDLLSFLEWPISRVIQAVTTISFRPDATQVPIFYAPYPLQARYPCLIVATVTSLFYFGLQWISWDIQFSFDSKLQTSWRVTCLVISAIPVIAIPLIFILDETHITEDKTITQIFLELLALFLFLVYLCAKISLILQAIALLVLRN